MPLPCQDFEGKRYYRLPTGYYMTGGSQAKYLHRSVWESDRGRPIPDGFLVHHMNDDKEDNRPENLAVMTKSLHNILHHQGAKRPPAPPRFCTVAGCGEEHAAQGYCMHHYDTVARPYVPGVGRVILRRRYK